MAVNELDLFGNTISDSLAKIKDKEVAPQPPPAPQPILPTDLFTPSIPCTWHKESPDSTYIWNQRYTP